MITPNQITFARILFIPLFVYFLLASPLPGSSVIAAVIFLVLALSDAFDGWMARATGQKTELGALIDPIADKLLVYGAFLAFIEIGKLSSLPVLAIIARDLLVTGIRIWGARSGKIIPAGKMGKIKTASQMAAVFLLVLDWPFQYIMFWLSFLLTMVSGWQYLRDFMQQERLL